MSKEERVIAELFAIAARLDKDKNPLCKVVVEFNPGCLKISICSWKYVSRMVGNGKTIVEAWADLVSRNNHTELLMKWAGIV